MQSVKVSADRESNPGHLKSSASLYRFAKNVALNPREHPLMMFEFRGREGF